MAEYVFKVKLHIYDLSQGLARQLSTTFLGKAIEAVWHTGLVVYGKEYYFSGGIQQDPAGKTPYGTPMRVVDLGETHVPEDVFELYLKEISPRFTAETYNLLTHNCNNFSNEVAQFLVGTTIPDYILQLPDEVMNSPMGGMLLPMLQGLETTLKSGAVPQAPQFNPVSATTAPVASSRATSTLTKAVVAEQTAAKTVDSTTSTKPPSKTSAGSPDEKSLNDKAPEVTDPLGAARGKVQDEIVKEFAAIMATGTLRASEAAALATRRVMERHGRLNTPVQQG
ncbi:desumoylating isopeptidase 1-like [Zingiber officinale]|nr:desumoylating isopeptidase 1-like [Zingiber officinale]XP_042469625.1 desumoylating isopeptidase 1-like [Zingiber officinale]XP_042469626.1 desumoylating isopeptidase 1-like [Zingiber officinale]